jgi:hypothetical protein
MRHFYTSQEATDGNTANDLLMVDQGFALILTSAPTGGNFSFLKK